MTETSLSIPNNVLDLRDNDFFNFIDQFCGQDIVEYFKLLGVRSVNSLLGINDIFLPLQEDYLELVDMKKKLTFRHSDGSYIIKIGIQHDINKLMNSLRNVLINKGQITSDLDNENELILIPEVLRQYPFLKRLIDFYTTLSQNPDSTNDIFLHHFLDNLFSNLPTAKNRHRYQENILDFALCMFILAGRNAYEFLRLNMPGALPTLTTIQAKLAKEGLRALEGEFRYNDVIKYMSTIDSKFAFCAEDCTTVQRKVVYDTRSNSFVGFTPPLDENGMPQMNHFQTNSIEDLKCWFEQEDISNLLNLYMIQPIHSNNQKISPYALSAYGTNGKYTSFDIIRRWFTIFEESSKQGVRILGYSTDADPRYLLAMRLVSGFFTILLNSPTTQHSLLLTVDIPKSWLWYFLPAQQLFLCMQGSIHICTKLRNRLLSTTAVMMIGDGLVTIDYLLRLIESQSKFNHNLVKSDVCPHDKQNFRSCEKLCGAIECLQEINGSHATVVYLSIIRCVIITFIDSSSPTSDRIYYAWLAVFICRLWRTWLDLVPKQDLDNRISQMANLSDIAKDQFKQKATKKIFFITSSTFLCLELNAHYLTYLTLLVAESQLPPETLKISLFSSQTCENFFRLARSMSGTFSTSVNFSVQQFLNRQEKISILNSIKTQSNSSFPSTKFVFPNHHKTQQDHKHSSMQPEKMTKQQIQEQVNRAFRDAFTLLLPLGVKEVLKQANIVTMNQVSQHIRNDLNKSKKKANFFVPITIDECSNQSDSDSEESITQEDEELQQNELYSSDDDANIENEIEDDSGINTLSHTTNTRLQSMKGVRDTINPDLKDSYFLVNIDGQRKYLHKNTAIWYLTDEKHKLSSDRLNRVMEN